MRTSHALAGTALLAALILTGCSGSPAATGETEESGSSSTSENTQSTQAAESEEGTETDEGSGSEGSADCPELSDGMTVEAKVLASCMQENMQEAAGYAATTSAFGMTTTLLANPAEREYAMTSDMGDTTVIGDAIYVKPAGGEWTLGDANSSDPMVAGLSAGAESLDMAALGATVGDVTGTLTVTGKDTRLGQDVWVVTGEQGVGGSTATITAYINADWVPLESNVEAEGLTVDTVVTEWNKKQDITAPM